jgi:hypothetical protein
MALTKRGRIVLIYTPLTIALVWAIVWVSANVWWTGEGYCFGSMTKCLGKEFTR